VDTNALINKVKENGINLAIILLCAWIAMGILGKKKLDIESLKLQRDNEQKKNAVLGEMKDVEQKISTVSSKVNTANKQELSKLTDQINALATVSKINITSMKPAVERSYNAYAKKFFEFSISAPSYHAASKFISDLERSPDLFIVESVNMQASQSSEAEEVTARVVVSTVVVKN
jgi:Tfp pilus assembly protein PilO